MEILRAAIQRYNIDIVNSAEWIKLQKYDQLCSILHLHSNQHQLRKSQKRLNTNITKDTATEGPEHQLHLRDNQPRSTTSAKPKTKSRQQRGVLGQH